MTNCTGFTFLNFKRNKIILLKLLFTFKETLLIKFIGNNLQSFLLRCGTRSYEWGTQSSLLVVV